MKKVIYKLYLTCQALIAVIVLLRCGWLVYAGVYDSNNNAQAKVCIEKLLPKDALENLPDWPNVNEHKWHLSLMYYWEINYSHPSTKYQIEKVESECSQYLTVSNVPNNVNVYLKNKRINEPYGWMDVVEEIVSTLGIGLAIVTVMFGLNKWIIWLFKS